MLFLLQKGDFIMAVSIRRWNEQDKNNLAYYANNEKISGCLRNTFPYPYTEEDAEFFIRLARHVHSIYS